MQLLGIKKVIKYFFRKEREIILSPLLNGISYRISPLVQKSSNMSHLTLGQRYQIEALINLGCKQNLISEIIGKDKSVISRELMRNCDKRSGLYKCNLAQQKCVTRHSDKPKNSCFTDEIMSYVKKNIELDFSPEQIVGVAKKESLPCVSIERIYQYIKKDKKQGGMLYKHLRCSGKKYASRGSVKDKRGQIKGRIDIDNCPKIVEERARFGDFEIDLVIGKNHKQAILTSNDRATGLLRMSKVKSKEANEIEKVAIDILGEFTSILHTITSDNGKEFANHINIAKQLEIDYFFAKPYHSWERGSNENLNGLIRQYFPKGSDFTTITVEQLKFVEDKLNNRPRKRFGYLTPNEVYLQSLTQNGKVAFMTWKSVV